MGNDRIFGVLNILVVQGAWQLTCQMAWNSKFGWIKAEVWTLKQVQIPNIQISGLKICAGICRWCCCFYTARSCYWVQLDIGANNPDLIKNVSSLKISSFTWPDLWCLCKSYIDGKVAYQCFLLQCLVEHGMTQPLGHCMVQVALSALRWTPPWLMWCQPA